MNKIQELNANGDFLEKVIYKHEKEHKKITSIASEFGIDRHSLSNWCKKSGYILKANTIKSWAQDNNIDDIILWMNDKYWNEKKTLEQIGDIVGVSKFAISLFFANNGIKARNNSEAFLNIPEDKRKKILKASVLANNEKWENMSAEKRLEFGKLITAQNLKYWASADEKKHKALSDATRRGAKKRISNWSEEQMKQCMDKLQMGHKKYYASLSMEEKREAMMKAYRIFRNKYDSDPEFKAKCIRNTLAAQNFRESNPEKTIKQALIDYGYGDFEAQFQLGFYSIDIAYPQYKLAIEIDGEYWHSLPKVITRDKRKNSYITNYCKWELLRIPAIPCEKQPEKVIFDIIQTIETIKNYHTVDSAIRS